jgi:hypothetical protein
MPSCGAWFSFPTYAAPTLCLHTSLHRSAACAPSRERARFSSEFISALLRDSRQGGAGDSRGHGGFLYNLAFHLLMGRVYDDKDVQERTVRSQRNREFSQP